MPAKTSRSECPHPERVPKLRACKSPRNPAGPFADLTFSQRQVADQWLWKFCKRWEGNLPNWRRAILIGVAKRLAKNPPGEKFGYKLHNLHGAPLGGRALARRCRELGIEHPRIVAMRNARFRQVA